MGDALRNEEATLLTEAARRLREVAAPTPGGLTCSECGTKTSDVWRDEGGALHCWPCARKPLAEMESIRSEVARLRHALDESNAALNREHEAHARHAADRARETRELHKACEKWRRLRERDAAEVERLRSVVRDYMSRHDEVQAQTVHTLLATTARERDAAMRRAGFAEPLVNLAMAEGLRAVEEERRCAARAKRYVRGWTPDDGGNDG